MELVKSMYRRLDSDQQDKGATRSEIGKHNARIHFIAKFLRYICLRSEALEIWNLKSDNSKEEVILNIIPTYLASDVSTVAKSEYCFYLPYRLAHDVLHDSNPNSLIQYINKHVTFSMIPTNLQLNTLSDEQEPCGIWVKKEHLKDLLKGFIGSVHHHGKTIKILGKKIEHGSDLDKTAEDIQIALEERMQKQFGDLHGLPDLFATVVPVQPQRDYCSMGACEDAPDPISINTVQQQEFRMPMQNPNSSMQGSPMGLSIPGGRSAYQRTGTPQPDVVLPPEYISRRIPGSSRRITLSADDARYLLSECLPSFMRTQQPTMTTAQNYWSEYYGQQTWINDNIKEMSSNIDKFVDDIMTANPNDVPYLVSDKGTVYVTKKENFVHVFLRVHDKRGTPAVNHELFNSYAWVGNVLYGNVVDNKQPLTTCISVPLCNLCTYDLLHFFANKISNNILHDPDLAGQLLPELEGQIYQQYIQSSQANRYNPDGTRRSRSDKNDVIPR